MDIFEATGRTKKNLVQLALPIQKLKGDLKFPLYASEKLDGVYCVAMFYGKETAEDSITIYSRTGEEYTSLNHLKKELYYLAAKTGTDFIIFEAYIPHTPQPIISGYCRDKKNQHPEVGAYIHDCLSIDEFNGEYITPYSQRYAELCAGIERMCNQHIHLVEQHPVWSQREIDKMVTEVYCHDGEGVVLRNPEASYSPGKRNSDILKIKRTVTYDLKVIALEEGKGKYQNACGKLICRWKDGKSIKVGSGLTDKQRRVWWSPLCYDDIVGKIVEIEAMAESSKGVLREPRFIGIRHDKIEGDF